MSELPMQESLVFSDFGGEPDLAWLVELFVAEMPERTQRLVDAAEQRDWDGLGRLAHQLKGSAGSYGFHEVTSSARKLEFAARQLGEEAAVCAALNELLDICRRARAGARPNAAIPTA